MMTDKELIRRALLGDQQAQRKCTDEEIILPCPLCGGKASVQKDISGKERYHVVCSNVKNACNLVSGLPIWRGSAEEAIAEYPPSSAGWEVQGLHKRYKSRKQHCVL